MRHRIGGLENTYMGLGADNIPYELDNGWSGNKKFDAVAEEMFKDALETICAENGIEGFDFNVKADDKSFMILFGFEPAYMHDPYFMVGISSEYDKCFLKKGKAKGYYGKDVKITYTKTMGDKKPNKAFTEFVDKWHGKLIDSLK